MGGRGSFPGGLRAQLLIGLSALVLGAFALGALIVENVLTRRLLETRKDHIATIAVAASEMSPAMLESVVAGDLLDAAASATTRHGEPDVADEIGQLAPGESRYLTVDGERFLAVAIETESGALAVATSIEDVFRQVAQARTTMLLFLSLVTVLVLAFGYGFFGFVVLRPIRAIKVATERAAQGDLASAIALVPRNEFGRVAASFNEMLERLNGSRNELEQKIEELQRANRELAETRDFLVRSEKLASVGQLAAGIAHEIGNPLAALSGYNELLSDGDLEPEDADDLLRRSSEQLERIREVIRNLLDFSRDESETEPQPTSLQQCVAETLGLVRALPKARSVDFQIADLAGVHVWAVPSQVVQVLVNLFINATDALASGGGGTVRVVRREGDDWVELIVEDDGPGVPPEAADRVFDPFFTTKDPGEGTGLGLAISARIVQSFGGDIRLEQSDLGGGCFVARFRKVDEVPE